MQATLLADRIEHAGQSSSNDAIESAMTSGLPAAIDDVGLESPFSATSTEFRRKSPLLLPAPHDTCFPAMRLLEGKTTASAHIVHDIHKAGKSTTGKEGGSGGSSSKSSGTDPVHASSACLFVFTDLSVRMRGIFRLQFSLIRLGSSMSEKSHGVMASSGQIVATVMSDPFPIRHARDFSGMIGEAICRGEERKEFSLMLTILRYLRLIRIRVDPSCQISRKPRDSRTRSQQNARPVSLNIPPLPVASCCRKVTTRGLCPLCHVHRQKQRLARKASLSTCQVKVVTTCHLLTLYFTRCNNIMPHAWLSAVILPAR